MLYRLLAVDQAAALPESEYERLVFPKDACLLPATDEERNAALGFITRSGDWNAESWQAAGVQSATHGLLGLSIKCRNIAAEIRRQEAEK